MNTVTLARRGAYNLLVPRGGTAAALRRRVAGFDSARDYFLHYGAALDERTCGVS